MPSYLVELAISHLRDLLTTTNISADLDDRFSTVYPPFDPQIHAPVDWDQLSLSTEDYDVDDELELLLPLRRKLLEDVERVEAQARVQEWTRDVSERTFGNGNDDDNGDSGTASSQGCGRATNQDRENTMVPIRESDKTISADNAHQYGDGNDIRSSPPMVTMNKRGFQHADYESVDDKRGKRRRSARIAAR